MTKFKLKYLFLFLSFICLKSFSQTTRTVDSLEAQYQTCLDKGQFMLGCANSYYSQMDSLLNEQFNKLSSKCDSVQKVNLNDDQLKWIVLRDEQFLLNKHQVDKEAKENGYDGGEDEMMILTDKNAMFVKDRVIELLNKTVDNYSADKYKSKTSKVSSE